MTNTPAFPEGVPWTHQTLELVPDAVAIANLATQRIEYANRAAADLLGYDHANLIGMPLSVLNPEVDETTRRRLQREIADEGRPRLVRAAVVDAGGEPIPCEIHLMAVTGADGALYMVNVLRDDRPRLAAERGRQAGEESFRAAFDQAPIGMALLRIDDLGRRTILRANEALGALLGLTAVRLVGMGLDDFLRPEDAEVARQDARELIAGRPGPYRRTRYRRPAGTDVWADLRATATTLPDPFGLVALAHLTDVTERQRESRRRAGEAAMSRWLARVVTELLSGSPPEETFVELARAAAEVTGAQNATLGLPEPGAGGHLRVATFGPGSDRLRAEGATFSPTLMDAIRRGGPPFAVASPPPDADPRAREWLGPITVVQVRVEAEAPGFLGVARVPGGEPFDDDELELLDGFARQVSLVVQLAQAREDQEQLALLEDRQRIARDLHDTVIQDLIALGMQVAAFGRRTGSTAATDEFVDQLESSVRRLREAIFTLRDQRPSRSLRGTLRDLVDEAAVVLGHRPLVTVEGPDRLQDHVLDQLLFVVREALSNVARHAGATRTMIEVGIREGILRLVVEDDGRGPADTDVPGDGLKNMVHRARALGGDAHLRRGPSGGGRLTWACPTEPAGPRPKPDSGH